MLIFRICMALELFSIFVVSILSSSLLCSGSYTISAGETLLPNQTIISKEGKFELGFFVPGNNSANYYVGIWYKNIPVRSVVWVLNRDKPIPYSLYSNSQLQISNNTMLLRSGLEIFWAYNGTLNATEAVILDTGNFVLRNSLSIQWQSFEHPTDTLLPGAKLDIESELVSWRNPNDPTSGTFSLGLRGTELSIKAYGNQILWSSGRWQGGTFISLSDDSEFKNSYNLTSFPQDGNGNGVYVVYNKYNESVLSRIVMDYMGRMMQFRWSEASQAWVVLMAQPSSCGAYALCGPNTMCNNKNSKACKCLSNFKPLVQQEWDLSDFSSGCVKKKNLQCADRVGFMMVATNRLPVNSEYEELPNTVCELFCRNNCTCSAYAYATQGGCLLYKGDLLDLESPPNKSVGVELYVKMRSKGSTKVLRVALVVPMTVVALISCFRLYNLWLKLKNKKSKGMHQNLQLLDLNSERGAYKKRVEDGESHGEEKTNQYELPIFSFSSIAASTNNFSITNKLGEGGFGPAYMGKLLNGQFVAVKRLSKRSGQGLEEFKTEIELIAKLQHRNLVGILGCCIENEEKILVYEYMPNKSLDFFIFEPARKEMLDWTKRVHIIEGIAQGLLYLHHYSRLRIVHRDLKASNILLDAEMNPKISDFGMARIFGGNDSQANTERIVGTYGYMSPEYAMEGLFSVKSDVFAFGVLMLEIISGKKNTGFYGSDYLSLLDYAWNMWIQERVAELVDPILEIPASSSSAALRYVKIGLLCVQENPVDRPIMSEIVSMLNNEDGEVTEPLNPAFTVVRTSAKPQKAEMCSVNGLTLSHVEVSCMFLLTKFPLLVLV